MSDFANFLTINRLKKKDIAVFLGVSSAFISQICSGERNLPDEKLALIKANKSWDSSMLTERGHGIYLPLLDGMRPRHEVSHTQLQSAVEKALDPTEKFLIGYLERKIQDQDALIRKLYQQIGMLEAKLELARKGEAASAVDGSLSADAV